ncbi:MAG: AtpZ/AtpI family protein [Candidatus Stahlbacteria bacterium]|nr:AtpZ/AtpI family protein [Candidatus Stahlbacteria bacterium]
MNKRAVIFTIIGVGWYVALSLLIPFGIGLWLDKNKFNSFPLLTLIGLGVGTIIMFYGVYRIVRQIRDNEEGKNKKQVSKY